LQRIGQQQFAEALTLMTLVHSKAGEAGDGQRKVRETVRMFWREVVPADGRHGQAIEAEDCGAVRGDIGAAHVGSGMLTREASQVFVEGCDTAGEAAPVVSRRQRFDADGRA
jgi:hypothetical protein